MRKCSAEIYGDTVSQSISFEIKNFFETGKEVSGTIFRVLEKGLILELEKGIEGIIPFNKMNKKEKKSIMNSFTKGDSITCVVMEVKPEEKKIFLFSDKINTNKEQSSGKDSIQEYLDNQEQLSTEKLEIPTSENLPEEEESE